MLACKKYMPEISDKAKATIDSLSKTEIIAEIEKGNRSRFQREKYDYLKERLAEIEEQEKQEQREQKVSFQNEQREYSILSNKYARVAILIGILTLAVALLSRSSDVN
jgi:hypothetical protein